MVTKQKDKRKEKHGDNMNGKAFLVLHTVQLVYFNKYIIEEGKAVIIITMTKKREDISSQSVHMAPMLRMRCYPLQASLEPSL
jgi:hypothetical protein